MLGKVRLLMLPRRRYDASGGVIHEKLSGSDRDRVETIHRQGLASKKLRVPANQRDYAWEDKHVKDLYQDFAGVVRQGEYFLGTIVGMPDDAGNVFVVDGQQRLATTTMLVAAIRDHFYMHVDKEQAKIIHDTYITLPDPRTKEYVPHLYLNANDHDYWYKRIVLYPDDPIRAKLPKPTRPSHRSIDKAASIAARRVKEIIAGHRAEDQKERLFEWLDFIREKARIIWVTVPDENAAYVIFETMNDRGLALSATDLLKNYLFSRADDQLEYVKQKWFSMSGTLDSVLEGDILRNYVRHYWTSKYGVIRTQELFGAIKKNVHTKQDIVEFVTDLSDVSGTYAALLNPMHTFWNEHPGASKYLETLLSLKVVQMRPLLLSAALRFSAPNLAQLLKVLVSWSVRFLVVGTFGSGALESHYGENAKNVYDRKIRTANDLIGAMARAVPSDEVFQGAFKTARVTTASLARYYLRALELYNAGDPEPEHVPNDDVIINLEHIMPEHPEDQWPGVPPDELELNYSRLGNQVLLKMSENSALGNKSFAVKKPVWAKSKYALTSMAKSQTTWRERQVLERQAKLAELALRTWPLKPSRKKTK
ncbi:MAG: DUF262 domain-containing protein [Bryobacteraceae bacterium]